MITTLGAGLTLEGLRYDNSFARLPDAFFERRMPTGIANPVLAAFNADAAASIDLRPGEEARVEFLQFASGNALLPGMEPVAAVYAGHQFGVFVSQLGDGRAILAGEVVNARGEAWELQLKGAGTTAYSRFGDGRAVLRSTIREYLASEAMHHLGIPTTRALAMTSSDEPVFRETRETAAMLVRMAPTFVRFGSFELFHSRRQPEHVKTLAHYTIERWFPQAGDGDDRYARFFADVVTRTADLMAAWQSVGFAHGVMNTDNFSILGLTLDYGPYGFLDAYEPGFICNHTDAGGRYAFDRQATVGLWNCYALANALSSLVGKEDLEAALAAYEPAYREGFLRRMRGKLGIREQRPDDASLILDLLELMQRSQADYTRTFRALSDIDAESKPGDDRVAELFADRDGWYAWLARYRERLATEPGLADARRAARKSANPKYVLRNYLAQTAIEHAQAGDFAELQHLHAVLRKPFDEQPDNERYAQAAPAGAET
ncbi:MAG: YdiU family protein, partial [Candidatus Velthaea sp.]